MSKLNTINDGYSGGSPRVRSENSKKSFVDNRLKILDPQELSDQIIRWYSDGKITSEGLNLIITQLQELCKIKSTSYEESIITLNKQIIDLNQSILEKQTKVDKLSNDEDIVETISILKEFFGEDKITQIKNIVLNAR
jgi:hypothetical protein